MPFMIAVVLATLKEWIRFRATTFVPLEAV